MVVPLTLLALAVSAGGEVPAPLVDAAAVAPGLRLDLRYASNRNVIGRPIESDGRCLLRPEVARALARAQQALNARGFTLVAWDCWRPRAAQWALWKFFPHPGQVANPARGSNHNRGAAVDVTLARVGGGALEMPTDFDSFAPQAFRDAVDGTSPEARKNREILRAAMRSAGFHTIRKEWWHFDWPGALKLPLIDGGP